MGERSLVYRLGKLTSCPVTRPTQPGHPSVGTRNEYYVDYGYRQRRNGEFCVTLGPVSRTVGY